MSGTDNLPDINHQEVWRIIEQELLVSKGGSVVEQVGKAFRSLQARRRDGAHATDVNLAAAEHYMYARFLTGTSGDPLVLAAPVGYALKKQVYFTLGIEDWMRTSANNPVLPPSVGSVVWGEMGVADGMKDYQGMNGGGSVRIGGSLEALKQGAY